jgi:hypothetical protein
MRFHGIGKNIPDPEAIAATIIKNSEGVDDVLFLGGEPCLYLKQLVECIQIIKDNTKLKVYVTTAVPKICRDRYPLFLKLLRMIDGINLSVQHHQEDKADIIRRSKSWYNRQKFYRNLPCKSKIRINLNLVRPWLSTKADIEDCLRHYDSIGFSSIKLSEIQHGKDVYVSFARLFGLELGSPYSEGCQAYLPMDKIMPGFKTSVLLKRSCFLCESSLKASFKDGVKAVASLLRKPTNKYGVVYEDGRLEKGWV